MAMPPPTEMVIYGHRGAAGEAPENTLAGIDALVRLGIKRVEIDLRLSADGEIMVNHDASLWRNRAVSGKIASLSAAAIAAATSHSAYPVPTLIEILQAFPHLEHLQLEIKPAPALTLSRLARRLAEIVELTHWPLKRLCATSSSENALMAVTRALPSMERGLVVIDYAMLSRLHHLGCSIACIEHRVLTRWLISRLRRQGIAVSAWTVNEPKQIQRLRSLGCDSIITDFPQLALNALR